MNILPQARYLAKCRQSLASTPNLLKNKNCLVVGATKGIGRAVALQLAKLGANVTISGRSKEDASAVLESIRVNAEDGQTCSFERVDFASQKDTKRFITSTSSKFAKQGGLDFLFTTAGQPPGGSIKLTPDGIDSHFALQCLGRYSTVFGFSDVMNKDGCVTVVCAPGGSGSIPHDDAEYLTPENRKTYGLLKAANRDSLFMDAILAQLRTKLEEKNVNVLHLFPGLVYTTASQNFPWPIPILARIFGPYIMTDVNAYSVTPVYEALHTVGFKRLNQYGTAIELAEWTKNEENRKMCVDYAERRIKEALATST